MCDEAGQPLLGFSSKWGSGIQPATDFRCVDAKQPNAPHAHNVDRVTVENEAHQNRRRALLHSRRRRCKKHRGNSERGEMAGDLTQVEKTPQAHAADLAMP
jgi:hypothetical protein